MKTGYRLNDMGSSFRFRASAAVMLLCMAGSITSAYAGAYIFAGENLGVDVITHPQKFSSTGGTLTLNVCIKPGTANASAMEIPVKNMIATFNRHKPTTGNLLSGVDNNVPDNNYDFESVGLHELGHCLGLAHPNAASESGLTGTDMEYTRATDGVNNQFDLDVGGDGVVGSSDDLRGDDVNMHWFRISNNNPFTIDVVVDSSTYSVDINDLPATHNFAANASRDVGVLLGVLDTEAVMQQGTYPDEAQRTLNHDDVATLLYAMSGLDETANTADDYQVDLVYAGISSTGCDITLEFNDTETAFAQCTTEGAFVSGSAKHTLITRANIYFNGGFNWYFNDVYTGPLFDDVSFNHWAYDFIQTLGNSGITSGCDANNYCPGGSVTRAQMAVFLERGMNGSDYVPPTATGGVFDDVPQTYWVASWIEKLAADGITSGCDANNYCPDANVSRAQMAVFLLKAKYGNDYVPPNGSGTLFDDVPAGHWAIDWIEQLVAEGITSGCGGDNYCPSADVQRDQMAVFLVKTFNL